MRRTGLVLVLAAAALASGCGRHAGPRDGGSLQTRMPGVMTSGGGTSGTVMAANAPGGAVQPGPAGTPGIPGGAGGNPGGTALGGTTPATAPGASAAPPAGQAASAAPAASAPAAPAANEADQAKQQLTAAMDAAAARWRARAATEGWATRPPTPVAPAAGVQASATPPAGGAQPPIRSEKLGTAPPSPDVRQPVNAPTDTHVDRSAPAAAGPQPHP